ncbi:hypothetical protein AvCA_11610 [Azotobacter vinelandii CA]|uniref:Uncharacterized protein n=2 Tax=Azotobacter vinelandii TaxID=354 RepID=C1DPF8_AZOVD|nr:hypothetical protein Avin_11610 [Azotobacter vinelandii DJ]AGK15389.1 hypothetical protein AvCA_11610 [Azotobacter vinelandii CA]AGK19771.1 hypothetical protein AvCA6_11610 [Azotobacter vinelandii CA6]
MASVDGRSPVVRRARKQRAGTNRAWPGNPATGLAWRGHREAGGDDAMPQDRCVIFCDGYLISLYCSLPECEACTLLGRLLREMAWPAMPGHGPGSTGFRSHRPLRAASRRLFRRGRAARTKKAVRRD